MPSTYHYGVPALVIWSFHILFGAFLIFVGWQISQAKSVNETDTKKTKYISSVPPWVGLVLLILGTLALFYHLHLSLVGKSFKVCPVANM